MNGFVLVAGGTFKMGNPLSDNDMLRLRVVRQKAFEALLASRASMLQHNVALPLPTVSVDSFWMSQYLVTQQEWVQVMDK